MATREKKARLKKDVFIRIATWLTVIGIFTIFGGNAVLPIGLGMLWFALK